MSMGGFYLVLSNIYPLTPDLFDFDGSNVTTVDRESLPKGKDQYGWPPCAN